MRKSIDDQLFACKRIINNAIRIMTRDLTTARIGECNEKGSYDIEQKDIEKEAERDARKYVKFILFRV